MDQEKQQKWEDQISEWRRSGLTQTEYCRRHNLKRQQFVYHKRRQESWAGESVGTTADPSKIKAAGEFIPLPFQLSSNWQGPGRATKLEVVLHNDIRLVVPEDFESKKLVDLVRLLREV